MSLSSAPVITQPDPQAPDSILELNRCRWFELFLVLLLAFSGSILNSIYILKHGSSSANFTAMRWTVGIFQETGILLLLAYILHRGGRTFRDIGFRWSLKDAGIGLALFFVSYAFYAVGSVILQLSHLYVYGNYAPAIDARQIFGHVPLVVLPFSLLNPFFEEFVVRAYLMTEIRALTGSAALAAICSVLLQTSYHLYYGWTVALSMGFGFLALAIYFATWRRALPIIVAHGIWDLVGYFRLH